MNITHPNRRHFLRAAGTILALPALESIGFRRFASAATAIVARPKRAVFLGFGWGVTEETQLARLEGKLLSVRERLRAHQEEAQCANCHRKIDPIGLGLENFSAAGKWRTEDTYETKGGATKSWPVDPAAAFHNGPAFEDYFELRDIIASQSNRFARGFTEALIEYSLGRPFGFTDEDLATTIVNRAREKNFAVREFIHALIASEAFHSK